MRILRALLGATVLLVLSSAGHAQTFTQVQWGINRNITPSPICVMNGSACLAQIGTIGVTNTIAPNGFVYATSYSTVQAAMTAAIAVNAALWMPCGTYTGAPATVPVGLTIIGEAPGCVGISTSAATGDIWTLSGFNYIRNVGFSYSGVGQRTSGAYIKVSSGAAAADIGDVYFRDGCEDTHWLGGGVSYLRNSVTERGGNGCRSHVVEGNIALHIISMTTGAASTSQTAALNVINAEVNCIDCLLQGALDDVLINPPSGKVAFFHAVNSYFDDAVTHAVNIIPNDGVVQRVALTNTWMVSRAGGGNSFNAAPTGVGSVNGITISQAHLPGFAAGTTSDIYLGAGVSNVEVSDVHVSGGQNGINCDGCQKLNVVNANVGPVEGFAAVTFGIAIQGAAKYINIGNSKVVGNVTGVTISGTADYITLSGVTSDNNSSTNFFCGTSGTHVQAIGNIGIPDFYGACGATPPYASVSAANTWALTQTFTLAPIFTPLTGYLKGNGASAITAAATVPLSDLAAQATNTIVGNATAGSAAPTALAIGSCSTAASALVWTTNTGFGCNTSIAASVANPTASVGLAAVNGTATSAMRSDGAPALSQAIVPTWSGIHTFSAAPVFSLGAKYSGSSSGTVSVVASATAGTPTITWGNASGTPAVTASAPLALSTTTGNMTVTGAAGQVLAGSTPAFTATPTLGVAGSAIGTLAFAGNTSGTATVTPQATAGSPTLTLPNASGTFAVSATSPVAVSATTGNVTCTTCATTTNGGALSGTSPVAISAAGAVSITGAAGQVLAGASPAFTATPTLGVAGSTVGSLALANATSGSVTLQPVTGALGSAVLSLPATTSTVAVTGNNLSAFASTTSAQLAGVISDETGSGALVFGTSPTLTTAVLGSSTATTQAANDNSTKLATTAYMDSDAVAWGTAPVAGCLSGGSITTSSTTGFVKQFGKLVWIEVKLVVTANTCGGAVTSTIPSGTTASTADVLVGHSSGTGDMLQVGPTSAGGTTLNINSYNNGVPGVTTITFSGLLRLS